MTGYDASPKPFELECGHKVWLRYPPDSLDDFLYCQACKAYVEQAPAAATVRGAWVIHPDANFRSKRLNKREYTGECLVPECDEKATKRGWFALRDYYHKHYMRKHADREIHIEYAERLPKNSPPPF